MRSQPPWPTPCSNSASLRPIYFQGPGARAKPPAPEFFSQIPQLAFTQDHPTPDPCGVCDTCRAIANGSALDFIEIDAASNTGVDNIRELIERAQFAPAQCRYKSLCD